MKHLKQFIFPVLAAFAVGILCAASAVRIMERLEKEQIPDPVIVNRIVREAELHPDDPAQGNYPADGYEFSIFDTHTGTVVYQTSPGTSQTFRQAIENRNIILSVDSPDGTKRLVFIAVYTPGMEEAAETMQIILLGAAFLFPLLCTFFCFILLYKRIIQPFNRLNGFSRSIAAGNLDVSLPMEKENVFGAYTEAFDLMRSRLREARIQTENSDRMRKELAASLSHDIKTPVTAIRLMAELAIAEGSDIRTAERLSVICDKAGHIDRLVTDMLNSALDDIGELKVTIAEEDSDIVSALIKETDIAGKTVCAVVPRCIIRTDRLRLAQVLGNILSNSYKYAGTDITVSAEIRERFLAVIISDTGTGVPEEDLPQLFKRFFRGSNAAVLKKDGAGLGLYTSRLLMERMGGSISCRNLHGGFATELFIPLA